VLVETASSKSLATMQVQAQRTVASGTSTSSHGTPTCNSKQRQEIGQKHDKRLQKSNWDQWHSCDNSNADLENEMACACVDKVNAAAPVTASSSARSVWERSEETSG
jgi:hypothetical protein